MKEQIKKLQLDENEEYCLRRLILSSKNENPEDWDGSGFPSNDNVRRAQLQGIIRRYLFTLCVRTHVQLRINNHRMHMTNSRINLLSIVISFRALNVTETLDFELEIHFIYCLWQIRRYCDLHDPHTNFPASLYEFGEGAVFRGNPGCCFIPTNWKSIKIQSCRQKLSQGCKRKRQR